jgi:dolichyl-phosphate beta-glucosyltransferase
MTTLTLVVPLYNEENCLEDHFSKLNEYLSSAVEDFEILLVNDGSSDRTAEIMDRIAAENSRTRSLHVAHNRGKGHAVRKGILNSRGRFVVFTDADLAVPVSFIGTCLSVLRLGSPVVIGSRHLPNSRFKVREGFTRQFLGEIFRRSTRLALFLNVSDITCGLKGFERKAALDIFARSRIERWGYDAEILFLAQRLGYAIKEIPVHWSHGLNSKVRIASDSVRTVSEILEIYYNFLLTNRYKLRPSSAPSTNSRTNRS